MDFDDLVSERWPFQSPYATPATPAGQAWREAPRSHAVHATSSPTPPLDGSPFAGEGVLVEEHMTFTLPELGRACGCDHAQLCELVDEGVIAPLGSGPQDWVFEGSALRRVRTASRLARDLQLNAAATALVLNLLDEIEALRAEVRRDSPSPQKARCVAVPFGSYSRAA